jgi:hypothetical protein
MPVSNRSNRYWMSVFLLVVSYLVMLIDSTIRAAAADLKLAMIVLRTCI